MHASLDAPATFRAARASAFREVRTAERSAFGPWGETMPIVRVVLAALALASCMGGGATQAQTPDSPRRVLALHPYASALPSSTIVAEAAEKRLGEILQRKVEVYAEFLDTARFPGEAHQGRTAAYLAEKYARISLDIVI